ncbi:MAG: hypothetical protein QOI20_212, partial [Acidimicrobiaceae bacterium]|nr:hypothetical protein [Acidimicrobiaceae bacterium]
LVSNTLALPVATRLGPIVKQPQPGGVTLVVPADRLADGQAVVALIGDRQVAAVQPVQAGVDLAFEVTPPPVAATFVVRVRVDGVDSIPLPDPSADEAVPLPTAFDPAQQVALP